MDITAIIENRGFRVASRVGSFLLRHALAVAVSVAVPCMLWTVAYFGLLLWVMIFGGGPGGPLAYPAGLLVVFLAALAASVLVFFPAVGAAELVARRLGWPVFAQLPLSMAGPMLVCAALAIGAGVQGRDAGGAAVVFASLLGLVLIPLILYWWVAQSIPLIVSLLKQIHRWFWGRFRDGAGQLER
jgi:hypothetical protein